MRSPLRFAVVPLVCLLLSGFDQLPRRAPEVSRVIILNSPGHPAFSIKSYRGRVVLVAFWNQRDSGFEDFIATLKSWYGQYRFRGLEIAAVYIPGWDAESGGSVLADLIKEHALEFPVMEDKDARVRAAYGTLMSPSVFCVDRKGRIRAATSGIFDMNNVRVILETLLEEAP
jgi:hypothetical protein